VVVSGPSGVGKSTIVREVVKRTGADFSVSATTRPPRGGEVDGREYRFVDRETFDGMVRRGWLLEWAEVFGHCYGTPARAVQEALKAGRTIILDIDVQGGRQVHRKMPDATFVLIIPPNEQALRQRLASRASENDQETQRRMAQADEELKAARESGIYRYTVVNDDLEAAIEAVANIVNEEPAGR